jgi:cystathionine beta-lyase family protein involved in aluminum resistance
MQVRIIKAQDPNVVITVDNCYGEFTAELEPCAVGADLAMGSLIKNPGGCVLGACTLNAQGENVGK